ncbi:peptidase S46-like protein [Chitinophaga skermanii]|uniref:Dipeptidyl-peptidase n=1 Tax=Chitinophaga skermanii TaxID=331697 RepID=A0A327QCK5_9BACT|nr:S46 family peptidase [Chitinophaga skermanii]RAJ02289.1 peptidase S46-like protein [Chitinophaga skermanii]
MLRIAKSLMVALFLLLQINAFATEGMWLPQLLGRLNEKEMKGMGMKISASDIYNVNKGSLKDAIVSFGGFCTGEIISSQGLLLTNHHCGYDAIQKHSSIDNNYLANGFWAMNREQELPNAGLTATFIVRIEDVTKAALVGVTKNMTEKERMAIINKNLDALKPTVKKEAYQDILVKPMFEANQYFLFVTETYKDVRLVGAPPSSIGKFGSDTDNWVWPRHTGDFSLFRVYAGKDGKPAAYSKDNVPLVPKHFLPISVDGIEKNDFTMVFGFPGRTQEYLPSEAVKLVVNGQDPARVNMRDAALKIIDGFMRKDEKIKIQYAAKYASTANGWKKWIGEMQGVERTKGIDRKIAYEANYNNLLNKDAALKAQYAGVLDTLNALYVNVAPYANAREYYMELTRNVETFSVADKLVGFLSEVQQKGADSYDPQRKAFLDKMKPLYQNINAKVDQDVATALLDLYFQNVHSRYIGGEGYQIWMETNKDGRTTANKMYASSALVSYEQLEKFVSQPYNDLVTAIYKDPITRFYIALRNGFVENVNKPYEEIQAPLVKLQREYMQVQMDVLKDRRFYPDANSTLRITYGKVDGYEPRDAVHYDIATTLEGVMEKYKPGDYEFDVPEKLRELYKTKDYGRYGVNGKLPVCFIASNHTTGGNSGSPALDAYGNLIGLNFDRTWEGTMSDINYDASICRNIMVDIRYVLFVIDKFAGAKHLVDEMKLVNPKKGAKVKPATVQQKRA